MDSHVHVNREPGAPGTHMPRNGKASISATPGTPVPPAPLPTLTISGMQAKAQEEWTWTQAPGNRDLCRLYLTSPTADGSVDPNHVPVGPQIESLPLTPVLPQWPFSPSVVPCGEAPVSHVHPGGGAEQRFPGTHTAPPRHQLWFSLQGRERYGLWTGGLSVITDYGTRTQKERGTGLGRAP